ncbi:hypothetical protein ACRRTK_017439 [Alexandromys fortis]
MQRTLKATHSFPLCQACRSVSVSNPELKKFPDRKLSLKSNGGRHVQEVFRGFDPRMNHVIDETATSEQQNDISVVVIRGNSILTLEALEKSKQWLLSRGVHILLQRAV